MIDEKELKEYVSKTFGSDAILKSVEKLGEGFHGVGFAITVLEKGKIKRYVLKTLREGGFGHEYPADRANVIIRALMDQNLLPNHVKVLDAGSVQNDGKLISLGEPEEFFVIMEEAKGRDYWSNLDNLRDSKIFTEKDGRDIKILADYLSSIHRIKYEGANGKNLYKRVVRDFVGHGELTMGVVDSFPDKLDFADQKDVIGIVKKMVEWWGKIKYEDHRLCVVHGDFHPGNILFDNGKLVITDRSRFRYGDPADDVSCLAINIINYSLMANGDFRDPFKKLLEMFLEEYFKGRKDEEMLKVIQFFFAFRALVCIHPVFYSADWVKKHGFSEENIRKLNENKKKMVEFAKNVLETEEFDFKKINSYLGLR
ncbi:MAG: phosphotransferase [Candidatus Aenigmatarchaeota archaeon]